MKKRTAMAGLLSGVLLLASCQSSDVLESASTSSSGELESAVVSLDADAAGSPSLQAITATGPQAGSSLPGVEATLPPQQPAPSQSAPALAALDPASTSQQPGVFADGPAPAVQSPKKTYLINGLLSAVPFIGYGFRNLKKKMPEAEIYSYMGIVEGPAIIAPKVVKEAEAAWRANPDTMINLVGISLGADLITVIADELDKKGVPVNYLGIVDGTHLQPIPDNVLKADNLTCSYIDCTRAKVKLAKDNAVTRLEKKVYRSSHIPLGNNDELHARVIAQSNSR